MIDASVGIAFFAWAPLLSLVVGGLYFLSSNKAAPLLRRVVASAYAPVAAAVYIVAAFAPLPIRDAYLRPLCLGLLAVPIALLVLSLVWFPGPRWAHYVLVPVAAACLLWQGAWFYWGVVGK